MNLEQLAQKAENSAVYNWVLNRALWAKVPFNRPHGFRITEFKKDHVRIKIPFKRSNFNHLKGLHACSMATAGEYASGLLLLLNLDPKRYRLIMKHIEADYFYQGKMEAEARFNISSDALNEIIQSVDKEGVLDYECSINIYDKEENHLATITTLWQIKDWKKTSA